VPAFTIGDKGERVAEAKRAEVKAADVAPLDPAELSVPALMHGVWHESIWPLLRCWPVIEGRPAIAYVVTAEPARLLAIDEERFWNLVNASHAFVINLITLLARRMGDQVLALVILPETPIAGARIAAERVRASTSASRLPTLDRHITISIGGMFGARRRRAQPRGV
jgi:CRP-like cAMP-binding protein